MRYNNPSLTPNQNRPDTTIQHIQQCLELLVNKASHNTVASLVVKINEVMGNLNKDTVAKACRRGFRTKIEAVVVANGDLFE